MTAGNDGTSAQLGRLLNFVADMATAIRLNSAYRGVQTGPDEQASLDVMWLSDSLHNFNQLGRALEGGDVALVIGACEALKSYYELFIRGRPLQPGSEG